MLRKIPVFVLLMMLCLMPSRGVALCVAEGGHLALELILCCDVEVSDFTCAFDAQVDPHFGCGDSEKSGDCTDVALAGESLPQRSGTSDALAAQSLLAALPAPDFVRFAVVLKPSGPSSRGLDRDHPSLPPSILNTSSIVLTV